MDKIFNLKIDTKIKNITTITGLKQFDNNSVLNITLTQNSLPVDLSNCTVRLNFLREDERVLLYMADIVSAREGKVNIKLSPEVLEKSGLVKADISVFDSNLMKITGTVFDMKVEKSIYSNDYYLNMKDFDIVQQMHIEEEKRINNEKERVQNENTRVQNEDKRINDENTRIKNEGTRIASEKERVQNENIRKENETTREKTFSNLKEKTQSNINIQEEKIKEITRINLDVSDNEAKRIEAEYIREKNSNTSISKEEERQANENKRIEAEKERINKEKERIEAEKTRQANENKRVEAEQERVLSENDRKSNELNRDKSEEERDLKESIRIEKEEERQANEKKRIDSEENRENTFKLMKNTIDNLSICEEYSNKKEYKKFNRVFFNGSCYECIKDCFNIQPGDIQYWLCIASKGKDGNGSGDMLTSTYDKNKNGKVDISELAESVDWENIKNKPDNFGKVQSVNEKTGNVVLKAEDIVCNDLHTVEENIIELQDNLENIELVAKKISIDNKDNKFVSENVEGALKECITKATTALNKAEQAFQDGVNVKNKVVSTLTSKGFKNVNLTTDDNWEEIINKIKKVKTEADGWYYNWAVSAEQTNEFFGYYYNKYQICNNITLSEDEEKVYFAHGTTIYIYNKKGNEISKNKIKLDTSNGITGIVVSKDNYIYVTDTTYIYYLASDGKTIISKMRMSDIVLEMKIYKQYLYAITVNTVRRINLSNFTIVDSFGGKNGGSLSGLAFDNDFVYVTETNQKSVNKRNISNGSLIGYVNLSATEDGRTVGGVLSPNKNKYYVMDMAGKILNIVDTNTMKITEKTDFYLPHGCDRMTIDSSGYLYIGKRENYIYVNPNTKKEITYSTYDSCMGYVLDSQCRQYYLNISGVLRSETQSVCAIFFKAI